MDGCGDCAANNPAVFAVLLMMIAGIDYGSKLVGTTVIAWAEGSVIRFLQSTKKQDADKMVLDWAAQYTPEFIMLDAPLSLPGVYRQMPGYSDYFYRVGDKLLGAMSPMFLGGLTARAMKLKDTLAQSGIEVFECYPKAVCKEENLFEHYAKSGKEAPGPFIALAVNYMNLHIDPMPELSWHHADALLALLSAFRKQRGLSCIYGDFSEGQIWV
jgi:predicted nuclease with RNAse H fold